MTTNKKQKNYNLEMQYKVLLLNRTIFSNIYTKLIN
ncbi:hypothetical protein EZS27_018138 [termite gut metagenome]|uniref:Uncharacterized protein n=1 Tax=termite gut metagenome TaxID=433724 RepID=A0A5J4RIH8_9ZZZZ